MVALASSLRAVRKLVLQHLLEEHPGGHVPNGYVAEVRDIALPYSYGPVTEEAQVAGVVAQG